MTADYLQMGGLLAQFRQRPAEAQKMLARASAVHAAAGLTISQAQAERNLANLLAEDLNERREAEVHYRLALALVERVAGRESSSYADIEASLGIFLAEEDCGAGKAAPGACMGACWSHCGDRSLSSSWRLPAIARRRRIRIRPPRTMSGQSPCARTGRASPA